MAKSEIHSHRERNSKMRNKTKRHVGGGIEHLKQKNCKTFDMDKKTTLDDHRVGM